MTAHARFVARPLALVVMGLLAQVPTAWAAPPRRAVAEILRLETASPLGNLNRLGQRDALLAKDLRDYPQYVRAFRVTDERFEVRLPVGYRAGAHAPLVVWINSGGSGRVPNSFAPALDARGVIAIGANASGNDRTRWERYQLALTAAQEAQKRYSIDPKRIYVVGFSGGARNASWLALQCPDVFAGGLLISGSYRYRGRRAEMARPNPRSFEVVRTRGRYVFMAGERDPALAEVRAAQRALERDGVAHAELIVVPHLGHAIPPSAAFASALDHLLGLGR